MVSVDQLNEVVTWVHRCQQDKTETIMIGVVADNMDEAQHHVKYGIHNL